MPSTGFLLPTARTVDAGSGTWTNDVNILADDGAEATFSLTSKNTTGRSLRGQSFGFDSAIPAGATIDQVNIRMEYRVNSTGGVANPEMQAFVSGTGVGSVRTASPLEPTTLTLNTFDITADRSWTRADLLDGTFEVRCWGRNGNSTTDPSYRWDYLAAEVVYTAPGTDAPAELASGTGTAFNATIFPIEAYEWVNGDLWHNDAAWPTAPTGTNAPAGLASGTGAAHAPSVRVEPVAGLAAATGTAHAPNPRVAPTAESAAATGTAHNTSAIVAPTPGAATATGTANNPQLRVATGAEVASATGTAFNATVNTGGATNAPAGQAAGTGQAFNPKSSVAPTPPILYGEEYQDSYAPATATGVAFAPSPRIAPVAQAATGAGQAFNATISTAPQVFVPAGLASGTGQAFNATVSIGPSPQTATATGTAHDAGGNIQVGAQAATATGVAFGAEFSVGEVGGTLGVAARAAVTMTTSSRTDAPSLDTADHDAPELIGVAR